MSVKLKLKSVPRTRCRTEKYINCCYCVVVQVVVVKNKKSGGLSGRNSRDVILEEMEFSDPELNRIEEEMGLSLNDTFDDVRQLDMPEGHGDTGMVGITRTEGEDVVLRYAGNFSEGDLAHEAVHGKMKQPDGTLEDLPGNKVENRLYSEFAARVAERKFSTLKTDTGEVAALHHAKTRYMNSRKKLEGEVLDEEFDSLYDDHVQARDMRDSSLKKEFFDRFEIYRQAREDVLAKETAESYASERDVDMKELVTPDKELFNQTIEYIRDVEENILERI